LHLRVFNYEI